MATPETMLVADDEIGRNPKAVDPWRPEHYDALSRLYEEAGLNRRADRLLRRARQMGFPVGDFRRFIGSSRRMTRWAPFPERPSPPRRFRAAFPDDFRARGGAAVYVFLQSWIGNVPHGKNGSPRLDSLEIPGESRPS